MQPLVFYEIAVLKRTLVLQIYYEMTTLYVSNFSVHFFPEHLRLTAYVL